MWFVINLMLGAFCLFGYIKAEKLYKDPLSKSEEEKYLREYFRGSKEAKDILIEHNLRLVAHIAKKYTTKEQELEDYTSIGIIGLIKAINSFKEHKGFKISTYASKCIENEILMYIRSNKKRQSEVSLNSVIGTDKDGNDMELLDKLEDESIDIIENIHNNMQAKEIKNYILEDLDEREKEIMIKRYGLDNNKPLTQQTIADKLKISRSYVSRIETKIQNKIKDFLKK